jgi:hypothetical protein
MAQPPQRSRSQTRAALRRAQSTACMASHTSPGGASEQFDFLAQVPSPALGGEQHQLQQQDAVRRLCLLLCVPTNHGRPLAFPDTSPSPRLWRSLRTFRVFGSGPFPCDGWTAGAAEYSCTCSASPSSSLRPNCSWLSLSLQRHLLFAQDLAETPLCSPSWIRSPPL